MGHGGKNEHEFKVKASLGNLRDCISKKTLRKEGKEESGRKDKERKKGREGRKIRKKMLGHVYMKI